MTYSLDEVRASGGLLPTGERPDSVASEEGM